MSGEAGNITRTDIIQPEKDKANGFILPWGHVHVQHVLCFLGRSRPGGSSSGSRL